MNIFKFKPAARKGGLIATVVLVSAAAAIYVSPTPRGSSTAAVTPVDLGDVQQARRALAFDPFTLREVPLPVEVRPEQDLVLAAAGAGLRGRTPREASAGAPQSGTEGAAPGQGASSALERQTEQRSGAKASGRQAAATKTEDAATPIEPGKSPVDSGVTGGSLQPAGTSKFAVHTVTAGVAAAAGIGGGIVAYIVTDDESTTVVRSPSTP